MASNVERNLEQMLSERGILLGGSSINDLLQENFGSNFYKDMDDKQQALDELEMILDQSEEKLKKILRQSFFDDDSIIDDIIYHLNTGKDINNIINLLDLNNQQNSYLRIVLSQAIDDYQLNYQNFKDQFIDNLKFIGEIGETIRGDKQFYTIGIQASSKGPLRNAVLKSEQWYELISQNKFFVLQKMPNGKRALVSNRQWTGRTREAIDKNGQIKIDPKTGKPIMEKVYSKTRGITGGELAQGIMNIIGPDTNYTKKQALQAMTVDPISQEIWNNLKKSQIYTQQSIRDYFETDDEDVLTQIFSSRKYEILNSGIWDSVYNEKDSQQRAIKINNIITSIQRQGFDMENIFGGAKGDTMLQILNEYVSSQQKFFGQKGTAVGIQVIDKTALDNSFKFYNQENIQKIDKQVSQNLMNNPQIQSQVAQTGMLTYKNSVNNLFMEFFSALTGIPGISVSESGDFEDSDLLEAIFVDNH